MFGISRPSNSDSTTQVFANLANQVCRTIADLAGSESVKIEHVAEAVHYYSLDLQQTHKEPVKVKKLEQLSYEGRMYLKRVL